MAYENRRFNKFAELIVGNGASSGFSWTQDTIKAILLNNVYTPDPVNHQYLTNCATWRVGGTTDQTLGSKTAANGVMTNTGVITWGSVPSGNTVSYVVFYKDVGGNPDQSPLIVIDGNTTGVALPVLTNGGNITYTPDATNGIMRV